MEWRELVELIESQGYKLPDAILTLIWNYGSGKFNTGRVQGYAEGLRAMREAAEYIEEHNHKLTEAGLKALGDKDVIELVKKTESENERVKANIEELRGRYSVTEILRAAEIIKQRG